MRSCNRTTRRSYDAIILSYHANGMLPKIIISNKLIRQNNSKKLACVEGSCHVARAQIRVHRVQLDKALQYGSHDIISSQYNTECKHESLVRRGLPIKGPLPPIKGLPATYISSKQFFCASRSKPQRIPVDALYLVDAMHQRTASGKTLHKSTCNI